MKDLWNRLERWLATHAPQVLEGLNPGASRQQITQFEEKLGVKLPQDFVQAYLIHNGQDRASPWLIDAQELLSLDRMTQEWEIWKKLFYADTFVGHKSKPIGPIKDDWWNPRWLPFTFNGFGDHLCIDLDPPAQGTRGQIITMWHDDSERRLLSVSFREWFADFVNALEMSRYEFSEEYGGVVEKEVL